MAAHSFPAAYLQALASGWRLFTLRRVARDDLNPSPEVFAALVATDVLLTFAFSLTIVGMRGEFNLYEFQRLLAFVPAVLLVGVLARRFDAHREVLVLPTALAAATLPFTILSSGLYLLAQHGWMPFLEIYWSYFDYFVIGWSIIVIVTAVWRLSGRSAASRTTVAACALVLLVVPAVWAPQGFLWAPRPDESAAGATASFHSLAEEKAFYAQHEALERELAGVEPERPGIVDFYVVAAALYAGEDVFMKETRMITTLLKERFDASGRIVTLINNAKTLHAHPIASRTSLARALQHVGEVMNTEEDVLLLYLTSHGSEKHELAVDFRPIRFEPIDPAAVKAALDESGIRWRVIVVSACYSGGFVDALKNEQTLVITASSADRQSFGCGNASDATYLAQALFGQALTKTHSFEAAFASARELIEQWEREKGFTASQPQIHAGPAIRAKLAELERRLEPGNAPAR
jgi:Peptidase C13 family